MMTKNPLPGSVRIAIELKGTPSEASELVDVAERLGLVVAHVRTGEIAEHFEILTDAELKSLRTDLRRAQLSASGLRSITRRRRILNRATTHPTSGSNDELVPISTMSSLCDRITKLTRRNRRLREMNQNLREELQRAREHVQTLKDANIQRWSSPRPGDSAPVTEGKEGMPE